MHEYSTTFPVLFHLIQSYCSKRSTSTVCANTFGYQSAKVTVAISSYRPSLTLGQVSWSPVISHCSRRCHDTNLNRLEGSWQKQGKKTGDERREHWLGQISDKYGTFCWSVIVVPRQREICDRVRCINQPSFVQNLIIRGHNSIQRDAEDTGDWENRRHPKA